MRFGAALPNGAPAVGASAVVYAADDPAYAWELIADSSGNFRLSLPASHPWLVARRSTQKLAHLIVDILDADISAKPAPGEVISVSGHGARFIATVNLGIANLDAIDGDVQDVMLGLSPETHDFDNRAMSGGDWECHGSLDTCSRVTYSAPNVVTIAENLGGADGFMTHITVEHSALINMTAFARSRRWNSDTAEFDDSGWEKLSGGEVEASETNSGFQSAPWGQGDNRKLKWNIVYEIRESRSKRWGQPFWTDYTYFARPYQWTGGGNVDDVAPSQHDRADSPTGAQNDCVAEVSGFDFVRSKTTRTDKKSKFEVYLEGAVGAGVVGIQWQEEDGQTATYTAEYFWDIQQTRSVPFYHLFVQNACGGSSESPPMYAPYMPRSAWTDSSTERKEFPPPVEVPGVPCNPLVCHDGG